METSVMPGCVVRTKLVGVIEARQKEKGEDWVRNDRLVAIATHVQTHSTAKSLDDLRPHLVEEIEEFFVDYNKLRKRKLSRETKRDRGRLANSSRPVSRLSPGKNERNISSTNTEPVTCRREQQIS
jgi:hypothetical protein